MTGIDFEAFTNKTVFNPLIVIILDSMSVGTMLRSMTDYSNGFIFGVISFIIILYVREI